MIYLLGIAILGLAVSPWAIIKELNKHHHRMLLRADARVDVLEDKLIHLSGRPVLRFGEAYPQGNVEDELTEEELARIAEGWKEF